MTNRTNRTALSFPELSRRFLQGSRFARVLAGAASLAISLAITLAPTPAAAQEWLKDRRYQEGPGIRVGDFEIHPGIGAEAGYDSNWFLRTSKSDPRFVNGPPQAPVVDAAMFRITPSFGFGTLVRRLEGPTPAPPPAVAFRGNVAGICRLFVGSPAIRDQGNCGVNSALRLDINQARPLGFGLFAGYQRLIQPSVASDPALAFNRNDVSLGGEVVAIPGGGTFDMRLGYQLMAALYEQSNAVPFTSLTHEISVRNRWKFRPRTALFHDTGLRFTNYPYADRALFFLNDSSPLRTRIGLNGLVSDRFGVLLAAGYGATFFRDAAAPSTKQFDSIIGQAEGTFYLSPGGEGDPNQASLLLSTLTFGYQRDFQGSPLGNFYTSNKGYLRVVYFFAGRVLLRGEVYGDVQSYPEIFYRSGVNGAPQQVAGPFTNVRGGGIAFAEYRFTDIFGMNVTFDYSQLFGNTEIPTGVGPAGSAQVFRLEYQRFQAMLGGRVMF